MKLNIVSLFFTIFLVSVLATEKYSPKLVSPFLKDADPFICSLNDGNVTFCSASLTIKEKKTYIATTGHCLKGISKANFVKKDFTIKCGSKIVDLDYHLIDKNHLDSIVSKNDNMILLPILNESEFKDLAVPQLAETSLLKSIDTSACIISGCSKFAEVNSLKKNNVELLSKENMLSGCKMVELANIKHSTKLSIQNEIIQIIQKKLSYKNFKSSYIIEKKQNYDNWAVTIPGDSGGGFFCETNKKKYLVGVHNSHSGIPFDIAFIKTVSNCKNRKISFDINKTNFSKNMLYILQEKNLPIKIDVSTCKDINQMYIELKPDKETKPVNSIDSLSKHVTTKFLDTQVQERLGKALLNCHEIVIHPSGSTYDEQCYCNFSQNKTKSNKFDFSCTSNELKK